MKKMAGDAAAGDASQFEHDYLSKWFDKYLAEQDIKVERNIIGELAQVIRSKHPDITSQIDDVQLPSDYADQDPTDLDKRIFDVLTEHKVFFERFMNVGEEKASAGLDAEADKRGHAAQVGNTSNDDDIADDAFDDIETETKAPEAVSEVAKPVSTQNKPSEIRATEKRNIIKIMAGIITHPFAIGLGAGMAVRLATLPFITTAIAAGALPALLASSGVGAVAGAFSKALQVRAMGRGLRKALLEDDPNLKMSTAMRLALKETSLQSLARDIERSTTKMGNLSNKIEDLAAQLAEAKTSSADGLTVQRLEQALKKLQAKHSFEQQKKDNNVAKFHKTEGMNSDQFSYWKTIRNAALFGAAGGAVAQTLAANFNEISGFVSTSLDSIGLGFVNDGFSSIAAYFAASADAGVDTGTGLTLDGNAADLLPPAESVTEAAVQTETASVNFNVLTEAPPMPAPVINDNLDALSGIEGTGLERDAATIADISTLPDPMGVEINRVPPAPLAQPVLGDQSFTMPQAPEPLVILSDASPESDLGAAELNVIEPASGDSQPVVTFSDGLDATDMDDSFIPAFSDTTLSETADAAQIDAGQLAEIQPEAGLTAPEEVGSAAAIVSTSTTDTVSALQNLGVTPTARDDVFAIINGLYNGNIPSEFMPYLNNIGVDTPLSVRAENMYSIAYLLIDDNASFAAAGHKEAAINIMAGLVEEMGMNEELRAVEKAYDGLRWLAPEAAEILSEAKDVELDAIRNFAPDARKVMASFFTNTMPKFG